MSKQIKLTAEQSDFLTHIYWQADFSVINGDQISRLGGIDSDGYYEECDKEFLMELRERFKESYKCNPHK